MSERKFNREFTSRMDKILKNLDRKTPWSKRRQALVDLEAVVMEGTQYNGFKRKMAAHQRQVGEGLAIQVSDLRSELVRQATHTISVIARELGTSYNRFARVILPTLLAVCGKKNSVIRGYGEQCVPAILQNMQSKGMLFIITEELQKTKDVTLRQNCMEFLRIALAFWPIRSRFSPYVDTIEEAIRFGLSCQTPATRSTSAQAFWLYAGHFGERRDDFMDSLTPRARRVVERGKTEEEEEQEEQAATMIAKIAKGHIARKKYRDSINLTRNLKLGMRVLSEGKSGTVRFVGEVDGMTGKWVGIESDEPAPENSDGSFGGQRLFECDEDLAFFVRPVDVRPEDPLAALRDALNDGADEANGDGDAPAAADDAAPSAKAARQVDTMDPEEFLEFDEDHDITGRKDPRSRRLTFTPLVPMDFTSMLETGRPSNVQEPTPESSPRLAPSTKQKAIESSAPDSNSLGVDAAAASHVRQPSMPQADEHDLLVKAHKHHLSVMGDLFQTEMDLLESSDKQSYAEDMVNLLTQLAERSAELKAKFTNYVRRVKNQHAVHDDFLNEMDNFGSL